MSVAEVGMQDIKRLALRGGVAKLISQAGSSALRLSFVVVAARLLEPEDFGLVAMVTAFTAMLDLFATAGLASAAVQRSVIDNKQISTLFWINILVGRRAQPCVPADRTARRYLLSRAAPLLGHGRHGLGVSLQRSRRASSRVAATSNALRHVGGDRVFEFSSQVLPLASAWRWRGSAIGPSLPPRLRCRRP